jgi:adenylosuccinate synthase
MAELLALDELKEKIERHVERSNAELEFVLKSDLRVTFDDVWSTIERAAERLHAYISNVSLEIGEAYAAEKRVVFEGAQGTLLDQAHGTVPFVTSSNTIAGAVTTGVGIGPRSIDCVLGVAKAYTTRVGAGPFPTELHDKVGDFLGEKGHEFGTTTGRKRRCGWFDTVAMKRAVRLNGMDSVAITKLDVLSGLEKVKLCIKYKLDGKELNDVPSLASELDRVEPVYIELDGWEENIEGVRKWHQLPAQARLYLSTISEIIACPISIVSVSPERDSTIFSSSASFVKNFVK